MNTRLHGKFLHKKLSEFKSALFFAEGDALIKLPNHLVTEMEITEECEIMFFIPKPVQDITVFDKDFPVRLEFFKKGNPLRLKVSGKGQIISDRAEMEQLTSASTQLQGKLGEEPVILVRVTVQYVDYAGNMQDSFPSRLKQVGLHLTDWLFSSSNRVTYAD